MGDKQKSHFGVIWVRATVEKRRREPRGGREEEDQGMESLFLGF